MSSLAEMALCMGDDDDAISLVYEEMDNLMRGDMFEDARAQLIAATAVTLPLILNLAFLSITFPCAELFGQERRTLAERVLELSNEPDLLRGLL